MKQFVELPSVVAIKVIVLQNSTDISQLFCPSSDLCVVAAGESQPGALLRVGGENLPGQAGQPSHLPLRGKEWRVEIWIL